MEKSKTKSIYRVLIRIVVSAVALYVVFRKIDFTETKNIFLHAKLGWLLLAVISFNISKIISAERLNYFFRELDLNLTRLYNLRLYYIGMFYNLFLPGGIGGDGYKIYLLNRYYKTPVRQLISATLLDRISGMVSLIFLAMVLALTLHFPVASNWPYVLLGALVLITFPAFYFFIKWFFKRFRPVYGKSILYSLMVQGVQLICAWCILRSLEVNELVIEYQVLFLVSSVVAVLPFTIGGVGARELVFILGSNYLYIDRNTAIAFSLMFFLITAVSSFSGIFLESGLKRERRGISGNL